ncbi:MAG: tetratricopeptide repeat protein, partial [Myxococcales bacterium]|nr:tetratricopeptide repeat protein [Myxococcales bacterium]
PRSTTELWARRLEQVAGDARDALELAAILGPRFGGAWRPGVDAGALVERALRAQVWWVEHGELRWTHELAREAVLGAAEAEGRLASLHRRAITCVDAELEPARAGRHHLAAGDAERAAALFLTALRAAAASGEWLAVDRTDRELRRALTAMGGGGRMEVDRLLERARMAANRWRSDEAWTHLASLRERVLEAGDVNQRGLYHWLCGQTLVVEQRPSDALRHFEQAEALHGADPGRRARLLRAQARCLRLAGDVEGALGRLRDAVDVARTLEDDTISADILLTLAVTLHTAGRLDEAQPVYLDAIEAYGEGYAGARSELWTNLGDLHRHRGDREAARAAYEHARPLIETTGCATDSLELGVALLDVTSDPDRARRTLEGVCARAAGTAQAGFAHLFLLQLCDARADWDTHWTSGLGQLPVLPAELDLDLALTGAVRRAEERGWTERARRVREARDEVRRKLGRSSTSGDDR